MMAVTEPQTFSSLASTEARERPSLGELLETHRQVCWAFLVTRTGNRSDAEDALQETWIRAHRAWPRYKEQGQFKAWLFSIARREAIRITRKHKHPLSEPPPWQLRSTPSPHEKAEARELKERVQEAIASLPDHEREAVWLRILQECSYKDIARIQGVPEGTVVSRVRRGLEHCRTFTTRRIMNPLPEEQEAWVQDLKQHWPDPGPAPEVSIAPPRRSLLFPTLTAAAAANVILALALPSTPPPAPVPVVTESLDWPVFDPSQRTMASLWSMKLPRMSLSNRAGDEAKPISLLRSRMSTLKTQETWKTLP